MTFPAVEIGAGSNYIRANEQFKFQYSLLKQNQSEKQKKHKIFDYLLSLVENKQLKFNGEKMSFILHPMTVEALAAEGWTQKDFHELEQSILTDADDLRNAVVLRDTPRNLYSEMEKQNLQHLIFENRIVAVLSETSNALICAALLKWFSESDLKLCDIFIKIRNFDIDGEIRESLRIDLEKYLEQRGFLIPIMQNGLIDGLNVFRHPNDERPFRLRARFDLVDKTKEEYAGTN